MNSSHFFNSIQTSQLYEIILVQNQKPLLVSLPAFLVGGVVGYFGYEYFLAQGMLTEGAFFKPAADLSTLDYLVNNATVAMMMMFGGILTLGAVALFLIFYNGVIVGESVVVALDKMPAGEVLMRLLPHGIFEVPALLLAGAGGFLSLKIVIALLREKKVNFRSELLGAGWLAIAVVLLLAVAAAVEAHITPALVAWLYGAIEFGSGTKGGFGN
ncbi:MAG: stage II sporulation protein M [Dethiobacteraceae bacterium]